MRLQNIFIISLLFALGCSDDATKPSIDQKQLAGLWVPYEIINGDEITVPPNITGYSIFGFYYESVMFNQDKTYGPAIWVDEENHRVDMDQGGYFEISSENKLILTEGGLGDMEFEITKYLNDDLWLKSGQIEYKLKREIK